MVLRLIQICRIPFWCSLFLFLTSNTSLGKFGPKYQNCQFELKFGTYTNLNMQKSMMVFTFSVLDQKNLFFGKSGPKNQNCPSKLRFGTKSNSNMRNSVTMFTFSVFDHKYPSWENLVQKFTIVCSKWNLIQKLIRICKIQWWYLFYLF